MAKNRVMKATTTTILVFNLELIGTMSMKEHHLGSCLVVSLETSSNQFETENKRPSITATHHPPCPRVRTGSAGVAGTAGDTAVPVCEVDLQRASKSIPLSNHRIGKPFDKLSSTPNTELVRGIQHLGKLGGASAHKLLRSAYETGQSSKRSRNSRLSLTAAYVEGSRRRSLM
ncbi:hypothetical protein CDEST_03894 [Colletotrichum destructivum]|uniref:Uncharacterized protein n=1 Tax=Colletotrichum destructivum TaxID=34406 RepID=A0AAX4I686_9PEZI|nr:hypothetical protein CDEST_03894 [Colletotrichum destructivum]